MEHVEYYIDGKGIFQTKKELGTHRRKKNKYDLKHPEVIAASRRLDKVIVRMMVANR